MRRLGCGGRLAALLAGAAIAIGTGLGASARAGGPAPCAVAVTTPDGLTIAAQVWGIPDGPQILFIHGTTQAGPSWMRQVPDPDLARTFASSPPSSEARTARPDASSPPPAPRSHGDDL